MSEKRLMLDIASAREGFVGHEISKMGSIRSGDNIADGLTKRMKQSIPNRKRDSGYVAY